jgi:hypothetical protein
MATRQASCSCGQLRVACEGEPVRVSICHCLACQKRTGSIFGVQARFPKDAVKVEGTATEYVRIADEGGRVTLRFCPACGATVFYELEVLPGFVGVPVGGFADPSFPAPKVSIYEARRHTWADMPGLDAEHLD